jgi:NMD protein affecting ribosome stability and mRNA decay
MKKGFVPCMLCGAPVDENIHPPLCGKCFQHLASLPEW